MIHAQPVRCIHPWQQGFGEAQMEFNNPPWQGPQPSKQQLSPYWSRPEAIRLQSRLAGLFCNFYYCPTQSAIHTSLQSLSQAALVSVAHILESELVWLPVEPVDVLMCSKFLGCGTGTGIIFYVLLTLWILNTRHTRNSGCGHGGNPPSRAVGEVPGLRCSRYRWTSMSLTLYEKWDLVWEVFLLGKVIHNISKPPRRGNLNKMIFWHLKSSFHT